MSNEGEQLALELDKLASDVDDVVTPMEEPPEEVDVEAALEELSDFLDEAEKEEEERRQPTRAQFIDQLADSLSAAQAAIRQLRNHSATRRKRIEQDIRALEAQLQVLREELRRLIGTM